MTKKAQNAQSVSIMGGGPDNPFLGRLGALSGTAPRPYFPFVGFTYMHFKLTHRPSFPWRWLPFDINRTARFGVDESVYYLDVIRARGMGAA